MINKFKKIFDGSNRIIKSVEPDFKKFQSFKEKSENLTNDEMRERINEIKNEFKELSKNVPEEAMRSLKQFRRTKSDIPSYEQKIFNKVLEVMPEVYAYIDEVFKRKSGHSFHSVQIKAAMVLAQGQRLVEMKTGEGKTRTFVLPLALYSLVGRGAHLATVNDYLSKVGGEYVGHFLSELGISVGIITPNGSYRFIRDDELEKYKGKEALEQRKKQALEIDRMEGLNLLEVPKKVAYQMDVTYGTNNEFGFDYLRDNMASSIDKMVQRELYFCVIDEADSILIDEARTPLIISGIPQESDTEKYTTFAKAVAQLEEGRDYTVDFKSFSVLLTEEGIKRLEDILGVANLWDDFSMAYHVENALKAKALYIKGDKYLVKNGEVLIVDEFTGRIMKGRRYSEGLHQAIEAKEGVEIKQETKTFATITFQNFFRLYKVLCGGSGTIMTEQEEFYKIYGLESVEIPTNKPVIRIDHPDRIYKTMDAKFRAVVRDVIEQNKIGRPVLIGTASVEKSELLSKMLDEAGVKHEVLNAKYHERESRIIAKAGKKGAVTVATNMAGRGTDIVVGGGVRGDDAWKEIIEMGGLYVIGTERHDSRRIDNQLRGRTGRQGEPGETRFYVSLEDQIMRVLGGEIMAKILNMVRMDDDQPIELRMLSKQIESAQKRIEGMNFDRRKNVVEYDDVMNQHREVFYTIRRDFLTLADNALGKFKIGQDIINIRSLENEKQREDLEKKVEAAREKLTEFMIQKLENEVKRLIDLNFKNGSSDENYSELVNDLLKFIPEKLWIEHLNLSEDNLKDQILHKLKELKISELERFLVNFVNDIAKSKFREFKDDIYSIIKVITLRQFDVKWVDHLEIMKDIRDGVRLQQYAQKNPLVEYKNRAFEVFNSFVLSINSETAKTFMKLRRVDARESSFIQKITTNREQIEDVVTGDREMDISSLANKNNSVISNQVAINSINKSNQQHSSTNKQIKSKTFGRNEKVSVKYSDGRVLENVKFKKVSDDLEKGIAEII
ncbi:MAG: protein translocase subunit SecA [Candidatus Dojkabacteria bacterium]|nr:MAG: protein translocase subunit SecA [Candidatus Dojkabacteria bacterium]